METPYLEGGTTGPYTLRYARSKFLSILETTNLQLLSQRYIRGHGGGNVDTPRECFCSHGGRTQKLRLDRRAYRVPIRARAWRAPAWPGTSVSTRWYSRKPSTGSPILMYAAPRAMCASTFFGSASTMARHCSMA